VLRFQLEQTLRSLISMTNWEIHTGGSPRLFGHAT
jgi:hypothetical protein